MSTSTGEKKLLLNAIAECGWGYETATNVLLEYIERQQSPEAFADYLIETVQGDFGLSFTKEEIGIMLGVL